MRYLGRIIGFILGFRFGGFFGGLFGFWLGYQIDKYLKIGQSSNEKRQQVFFDTTFLVMGHVAKADGTVSVAEINKAKEIMQRLNLSTSQKEKAKDLFNQGKENDFDIDLALAHFRNVVGSRNNLAMMFLEIQISASLADGNIHPLEREILLKVCSAIGVPQVLFEQIVNMIIAGQNFSQSSGYSHSGQSSQQNPEIQLEQAYQTLGLSPSATDAEIKRAYRKLISQHHPDKLQAKGLPDEMLKIAADKTHAIKQAYEIIKNSRNFK